MIPTEENIVAYIDDIKAQMSDYPSSARFIIISKKQTAFLSLLDGKDIKYSLLDVGDCYRITLH